MHAKTPLLVLVAGAALVTGCGSGNTSPTTSSVKGTAPKTATSAAPNPNAKEKSPPGDIPDSTQFVRFKLAAGGFSVKVPEGWSRTGGGNQVTFTSNLNSVTVAAQALSGQLNANSVRSKDVPALAAQLKAFKLQEIRTINRSGQQAVRIEYLAKGPANSVTGKAPTDAVQRYLFAHNGEEAVLTLAGPKGADNVDPWRTISDSVQWTG